MKNHPYQCNFCNLFISYEKLGECISWQPYGGASDFEPRDNEYAHKECWEKADQKRKDLIVSISYIKPR